MPGKKTVFYRGVSGIEYTSPSETIENIDCFKNQRRLGSQLVSKSDLKRLVTCSHAQKAAEGRRTPKRWCVNRRPPDRAKRRRVRRPGGGDTGNATRRPRGQRLEANDGFLAAFERLSMGTKGE